MIEELAIIIAIGLVIGVIAAIVIFFTLIATIIAPIIAVLFCIALMILLFGSAICAVIYGVLNFLCAITGLRWLYRKINYILFANFTLLRPDLNYLLYLFV